MGAVHQPFHALVCPLWVGSGKGYDGRNHAGIDAHMQPYPLQHVVGALAFYAGLEERTGDIVVVFDSGSLAGFKHNVVENHAFQSAICLVQSSSCNGIAQQVRPSGHDTFDMFATFPYAAEEQYRSFEAVVAKGFECFFKAEGRQTDDDEVVTAAGCGASYRIMVFRLQPFLIVPAVEQRHREAFGGMVLRRGTNVMCHIVPAFP